MELYQPLVGFWCRLEGLFGADADDVQQEVFLAVARSLGRFERRKEGAFRCWLRTITRSKANDLRRRAQERAEGGTDVQERLVQVPAGEATVADEPPDAAEVGILYRRAMELIRRDFTEGTCKAFLGTAVEKRSAADVAADLGMSANAVRLAKARVLQRLRVEFAELIEA
jgi:RNA polymerase sigma-70 factor (ECF subfamily)